MHWAEKYCINTNLTKPSGYRIIYGALGYNQFQSDVWPNNWLNNTMLKEWECPWSTLLGRTGFPRQYCSWGRNVDHSTDKENSVLWKYLGYPLQKNSRQQLLFGELRWQCSGRGRNCCRLISIKKKKKQVMLIVRLH